MEAFVMVCLVAFIISPLVFGVMLDRIVAGKSDCEQGIHKWSKWFLGAALKKDGAISTQVRKCKRCGWLDKPKEWI